MVCRYQWCVDIYVNSSAHIAAVVYLYVVRSTYSKHYKQSVYTIHVKCREISNLFEAPLGTVRSRGFPELILTVSK